MIYYQGALSVYLEVSFSMSGGFKIILMHVFFFLIVVLEVQFCWALLMD